jgi:hypothetical protein
MGSTGGGGVVSQPILGRAAATAAIQAFAIPFLWLARRERAESDPIAAPSEAAAPTSR